MNSKLLTIVLITLIMTMTTVFAQPRPSLDLGKYGISINAEQKAQIIADIRQSSPWIPLDSTIEISLQLGLAISDNVEQEFVDDPALTGNWKAIDFVAKIEGFDPGIKQFQGNLYWNGLVAKKDGYCDLMIGNQPASAQTWTKGCILMNNMAQAYQIKSIKGKNCLFVQWKSGDYSLGGQKPAYYVFVKK